MLRGLLIGLYIFLAAQVHSQPLNGCDGVRYVKEVFTDVEMQTVKFGENTDAQDKYYELLMDVYTPVGDFSEFRPVIIWVFGGAFISGEREDMASYCEQFAKLGYVTATIDYRIWDLAGGFPDSTDAMNVAIMAMGDLKASIRHMRQSFDEGNPYGIDPENIIVGGLSAGSITTLLAGVVDESDNLNDFFNQLIDANGGYEGNSGDEVNQSYSSEILAMINLSGAVYDTSWIDVNDPPIISFHGTADQTVKFNYGYASVLNFDIIPLHGSGNIQLRQEHLGKNTFLKAVQGGNHYSVYLDAAYEDDRQEFMQMTKLYLYDLICMGIPLSANDTEQIDLGSVITPNPVSDMLYLKNDRIIDALNLEIVDIQGRRVFAQTYGLVDEIRLPTNHLVAGVYSLLLQDANNPGIRQSIRFVKL
jgi:hypothetical protein